VVQIQSTRKTVKLANPIKPGGALETISQRADKKRGLFDLPAQTAAAAALRGERLKVR